MSPGGIRILLVGLMGAGKSSVGTALASALGVPYLDNDTLVEAATGSSKAALLEARGRTEFHRMEAAIALALMQRQGPFVGALPASAPLDPAVAEALQQRDEDVRIVWLRASLDTLTERLTRTPSGRPFLALDPRAALVQLAPEREAAYAAVADLTVDVDGRSPEVLATEIEAALSGR